MKIGLIDVDGHHFPNLALMRISAYHKDQGDTVEWWKGDLFHYDRVYKSKIFSDAYSQDVYPQNADEIIQGGTGYCITLHNGMEIFDTKKKQTDTRLHRTHISRLFNLPRIRLCSSNDLKGMSKGMPVLCGWQEGRTGIT